MVNTNVPPDFQVLGCPVGDGKAECSRGCAGWWRGLNTAVLTQAILSERINPKILCDPLTQRILDAQAFLGLKQTK